METFFLSLAEVNLFLQQLGDALVLIARLFTSLGDEIFYLVFMPFIFWCVDSATGLRLGAMLMFSNIVSGAVKMIFHWPRPFWVNGTVVNYVDESSFGFPSGHSANAASVWGVAAARVKQRWFRVVTILTVLMIGFSRLVLGVHFVIDVIGGWVLGLLLLLAFLRYEGPVTHWFNQRQYRHQMILAVLSSILLILPGLVLSWWFAGMQFPADWAANAGAPLDPFNPSGAFTAGGTWAGFLCGFLWFRRRHGRFSANVELTTRLLRFGVGMMGAVVLWAGLDRVFPDTTDALGLSLRYLRYFLTGFWVTGLAPFIFVRVTDSIFNKSKGTMTQPKNTLQ